MKKTIVFLSLFSLAAVLSAQNWQPGSLDDALAFYGPGYLDVIRSSPVLRILEICE